jgi:hypothetical protein
MGKAFLFLFLIGCSPHKISKKDYLIASESPCVDGTIVNINQAGCESLYYGIIPDSLTLKIRCTYAPEDSVWTRATFYAVPSDQEVGYSNWFLFCEDRYVKMYSAPYGIKLDND